MSQLSLKRSGPEPPGRPGSLGTSGVTVRHPPRSDARQTTRSSPVVRAQSGTAPAASTPAAAQRSSASSPSRGWPRPADDQQRRHIHLGSGPHGLRGENVGNGLLEARRDVGHVVRRTRALPLDATRNPAVFRPEKLKANGSSRGYRHPRGKVMAARSPVLARSSSTAAQVSQTEQPRVVVGLAPASSTVLPSSTIQLASRRTCNRFVCPPTPADPRTRAAAVIENDRRQGGPPGGSP